MTAEQCVSSHTQQLRVQLQETSDSLAVLAGHLGYKSEVAFCRAFKRVFGESPGSLRKTAKADFKLPTTAVITEI
ncbi:MAG: AraC family transcriptional regulator [Gammaproteobacteria bacterium]|nr:AraC family transcriptional regulator [Gammaproteobacteria bacterium]MDH3986157.1 AraC family transcriptional regulator [Gammaproteobacteria bacterium]